MGLFSDAKAVLDVQKLKKGGTANISISQITNLIVNMTDAQKNLNQQDFASVYSMYLALRKCKSKMRLDMDRYYETASKIIFIFDNLAPYSYYSGGNCIETEFMLQEVRKLAKEDQNFASDIIHEVIKRNTYMAEKAHEESANQFSHRYTLWEQTPLKWHKFLTYIVGPLSLLVGVSSLTQTLDMIEGSVTWVFAIDFAYALARILLGLFMVLGGRKSARKRYAPICSVLLYLVNGGYCLYYVGVAAYFNILIDQIPSQIITATLFLATAGLTVYYYSKRKALFVY